MKGKRKLALFKPPARLWMDACDVAPSGGDFDELHLSLQATGTNSNVTMSYPPVTFYHCYYNPHLMTFHTLPLTFDLMGFYMTLGSVCL